MSAKPERTEAELLAEAREAWRTRLVCESQISRLSRYSGLTPQMKADRAMHQSRLFAANTTLTRVLGGAP